MGLLPFSQPDLIPKQDTKLVNDVKPEVAASYFAPVAGESEETDAPIESE